MRYIYYCLYCFIRQSPSKASASLNAAMFTSAVPLAHLVGGYFVFESLFHFHSRIPHAKMILAGIAFSSALLFAWYYEFAGQGRKIIASFSDRNIERRCAIFGFLIFLETLLLPALAPYFIWLWFVK